MAGLAHIWSSTVEAGGGSLTKYSEYTCCIVRLCSQNKHAQIGMWADWVSRTDVRRQGDTFIGFKDKTVILVFLVLHKMLKRCLWIVCLLIFVSLVCDFLGEKIASVLGISTPKYQYAIDEYYRMKKEVCLLFSLYWWFARGLMSSIMSVWMLQEPKR